MQRSDTFSTAGSLLAIRPHQVEIASVCLLAGLAGAAVLAMVSVLGTQTSVILYVLVLGAGVLGAVLIRRPTWIVWYFAWVAGQNFILPWLNSATSLETDIVRAAIGMKEAIAVVLLCCAMYRCTRQSWLAEMRAGEWLLLGYGCLLLLALLSPWPAGLPFGARLVGFRTLMTPFVFVFIGRFWASDDTITRSLVRSCLLLSVLQAGFGFFERFFLPIDFWSSVVGMGSYLTDVKGIPADFHVEGGLVANMYRFGFRRLVSVFGDPLACGYALIFPIMTASALLWPRALGVQGRTQRARLLWTFGILACALLLTINRGAILTVVLALAIMLAGAAMFRYCLWMSLGVLALSVLQPNVARLIYETITLQEGSARSHFDHLVIGLSSLISPNYLLGLGLGRSGFWAQELYGTTVPGVGENAYFMIILQVGYLGALLFVAFMMTSGIRLKARGRVLREPLAAALCRAAGACLLAHVIVGNTSESMFSFTGMSQAWFFVGLALASCAQHERDIPMEQR